jgi:S-adenosylmethionine hydrolase
MNKIIVFQSDFGLLEGTVAQMYGVALTIDPQLRLYDLTHNIPVFDTWAASYSLYQTIRVWPAGTVFVSVVDPGVGSERQSVVVKTAEGHFIVTPNNGSLTHVHRHCNIVEVRQIDETIYRRPGSENIHIFHGRDVYAYSAAYLASGKARFEDIGPIIALDTIVTHPIYDSVIRDDSIEGIIEIDDPHFGMVWTNIPGHSLTHLNITYGDSLSIEILYHDVIKYSHVIPFVKSFAYVNKGEDLVYMNEMGNLAIATNLENFTLKRGIGYGNDWKVVIKRPQVAGE